MLNLPSILNKDVNNTLFIVKNCNCLAHFQTTVYTFGEYFDKGLNSMFYVQRDAKGEIQSIQKQADDLHQECLDIDDPGIASFFANSTKHAEEELAASDLEMARAVEDLIEVLINKHVINFTDLPEMTQKKIIKRKRIRDMLKGVI